MIKPAEVQDEDQQKRMQGFLAEIGARLKAEPMPPDGRVLELWGLPREDEIGQIIKELRKDGWRAAGGPFGGMIWIGKPRKDQWPTIITVSALLMLAVVVGCAIWGVG